MEEQEWRRHARRHGPLRTNQGANGVVSPRASSGNQRLSSHTIASASKAVGRTNEPRENGLARPTAGPSRWKEMRQAVRIKATIDTDERRTANAKIADLCAEDRDKVAKLVRRIVEVSALHEQSAEEFQRQRAAMESEIQELRGHVKRDTNEIEELSDKLKDALGKLCDYQERVLVLEESNELEVRHRLETDQTVDLLKLEVDKLRKLVKRQRQEMEAKESGQQQRHREEMEQLTRQLQETHEQLLTERRERLEEKQRELEDRIQRTAPSTMAPDSGMASTANKYDPPESTTAVKAKERVMPPADMFSFLNTSVELPDKIKEIMSEWKSRMEDALNTTAASIAQDDGAVACPRHVVSTGMQTEATSEEDLLRTPRRREASASRLSTRTAHRGREAFDRMLVGQTPSRHDTRRRRVVERSVSPPSLASSSVSPPHEHRSSGSSLSQDRSVTRALLDDFANASVLVDDDSFEDEVESTIALLDGFQTPDQNRSRVPRRKLSLYDSSMLDVVDVIESDAVTIGSGQSRREASPRSLHVPQEDSPTVRVERLLEGLKSREERLARVGTRHRLPSSDEPSFLRDVELFNEVKDVYTQHLHERRREGFVRPHHSGADEEDEYASETSSPLCGSQSPPRCLSVQEAIERDMQELLRQEGGGAWCR